MPGEARVWIYAFDSELKVEQEKHVREGLDHFVTQWSSHGEPVEGHYQIHEQRFVIVAGYCTDGISGCSIDSKVKVFKDLHDRFGLNALGGTRVFYRAADGHIQAATRPEFRQMVSSGDIEDATPVFDLTARTINDLKTLSMEQPYSESWAVKVFGDSEREPAA